MSLIEALILGIVEGLTEYLPVSSTGHLIVAQRLLGIEASEAANAYAIAIQAGAILAVLGLYRQRLGRMVAGVAGQDETGRRLALAVGVAFVPAAAIGFALDDVIDAWLFGPGPVVIGWIVGAVVMLAMNRRATSGTLELDQGFTLKMALVVGLAQCLALWPGVSRSLATILGGVIVGLSLPAAVEFSFLLGVVTLGAATVYKGIDSGAVMLDAYGPVPLLVGFAASWLSAVLAVRGMVAWLQRRGLGLFAGWRLLAAALVGGMIVLGEW